MENRDYSATVAFFVVSNSFRSFSFYITANRENPVISCDLKETVRCAISDKWRCIENSTERPRKSGRGVKSGHPTRILLTWGSLEAWRLCHETMRDGLNPDEIPNSRFNLCPYRIIHIDFSLCCNSPQKKRISNSFYSGGVGSSASSAKSFEDTVIVTEFLYLLVQFFLSEPPQWVLPLKIFVMLYIKTYVPQSD